MTAGIYHDKRILDGIHVSFQGVLKSVGNLTLRSMLQLLYR